MNISLTRHAHRLVREVVTPGDIVIDATVGNGHDTLFLAQLTGKTGMVYGFDIQQQAIDSTSQRLLAEKIQEQTRLFHAGHEMIAELIPETHHGYIRAAMFNLGYLPGSDKTQTTTHSTTLSALEQLLPMLSENGVITMIAYTGHPGGELEYERVRDYLQQLPDTGFELSQIPAVYQSGNPVLLAIRKSRR